MTQNRNGDLVYELSGRAPEAAKRLDREAPEVLALTRTPKKAEPETVNTPQDEILK